VPFACIAGVARRTLRADMPERKEESDPYDEAEQARSSALLEIYRVVAQMMVAEAAGDPKRYDEYSPQLYKTFDVYRRLDEALRRYPKRQSRN
jgi:hypothetical protein